MVNRERPQSGAGGRAHAGAAAVEKGNPKIAVGRVPALARRPPERHDNPQRGVLVFLFLQNLEPIGPTRTTLSGAAYPPGGTATPGAPAARNLGNSHGTWAIAPFVKHDFERGSGHRNFFVCLEYCAAPLCPFDLLPSPKLEGNYRGANYPRTNSPSLRHLCQLCCMSVVCSILC